MLERYLCARPITGNRNTGGVGLAQPSHTSTRVRWGCVRPRAASLAHPSSLIPDEYKLCIRAGSGPAPIVIEAQTQMKSEKGRVRMDIWRSRRWSLSLHGHYERDQQGQHGRRGSPDQAAGASNATGLVSDQALLSTSCPVPGGGAAFAAVAPTSSLSPSCGWSTTGLWDWLAANIAAIDGDAPMLDMLMVSSLRGVHRPSWTLSRRRELSVKWRRSWLWRRSESSAL